MTEAFAPGLDLRALLRGVHRSLAECLRILSVYLGIAVIVTVSLGFALPGLRGQALQVHEALLAALAPSSSLIGSEGALTAGADSGTAVALAVPETPASNATGYLGPARIEQQAREKRAAAARTSATTATSGQVDALRSYISRKYKVAYDATSVLVGTAYKVGRERKVDPLLLLAVIAIESRYNPFAESQVGAQGLMQVMTTVHQDKFDAFGKDAALDPVANISVGSMILRDCIDRRGSVNAGLSCYVGASGPNDGGYSSRVQAERRRLALAAGIPLARED
jgi:soluble lytic murein transglycosylase-like protein